MTREMNRLDHYKTSIHVNQYIITQHGWEYYLEKPEDQESTPPAWTIILSKFLLTDAQITTDDRAENKVSKYEIPEGVIHKDEKDITDNDLLNAVGAGKLQKYIYSEEPFLPA